MPAETHSRRSPVDRDEVARVVRERLAEILGDRRRRRASRRAAARRPRRRRLRADRAGPRRSRTSWASARSASASTTTISSSSTPSPTRSSASLGRGSRSATRARRAGSADAASSRRSASPSTRSRRASATGSATARISIASLVAPLVVRGERRSRVERAPRVPRRLRARSRRHRLRVQALPAPSRRPALGGARRRRERARARRGRGRDRPRRVPAARQGRGRGRRAREAVDPRRRVRGRDRRGVPRRRSRRRDASSCSRCFDERIGEAADRPGRPRLQDRGSRSWRRPAVSGGPGTSCATRAPTTPSSSSRSCCSTVRASGEGEGELEEGSRAGGGMDRLVGFAGGGRKVPELPEVEVLRRDLERDIVGKKIKSVEVDGLKPIRRHRTKKEFTGVLDGRKITGVERRGRYLAHAARRPRRAARRPRPDRVSWCARRPRASKVTKGTHVVITFTQGGQLRYSIPKTFGEMFVTPLEGIDEQVTDSPRPASIRSRRRSRGTDFGRMHRGRHAKLKPLLMDSAVLTGIGHVYSDEILFAAGLRWDRESDSLTDQEVRRLYRAIVETVQEAVKYRGIARRGQRHRPFGVGRTAPLQGVRARGRGLPPLPPPAREAAGLEPRPCSSARPARSDGVSGRSQRAIRDADRATGRAARYARARRRATRAIAGAGVARTIRRRRRGRLSSVTSCS